VERLPFRTARLLLRPVTEGDLPRLFAILADAEVMKLALYERPLTLEEAQKFVDDDFSKDSEDVTHLGVLCRNDDDVLLGFAGLLPCRYFPEDLEFGFVLAREHHRKGYATEIGRKLIEVGLGALGRSRILALCDPRNMASRGVLETLGMTRVGDEILTRDRGPRIVFETSRR
jgi:RimJ/RimL family protein N-acetyltransferase